MGHDDTRTLDSGSPPRDEAAQLAPGAHIGRYRITRAIDRGGMGAVYEAIDPSLDRKVAIKVLLPRRDPGEAARLVAEARALAGLNHPNVVHVYEVGVADAGTYLAMELVEGTPASAWLAAPRSTEEIIRVFAQVARGLAAAHAAGIVHRDVKPANIVVGADRVRLVDFGIALVSGAEDGRIAGTPAYMAPEQRAGRADARSDQYAFCVSLAEAFARAAPEEGVPPRVPASVPAHLARLIAHGLAARPEDRHPSMEVVVAELERSRGDRGIYLAAGGAVAAAGAAIAFAVIAPRLASQDEYREPPCRGFEQRLAGVWDDGVRDKLTSAFARLPDGAGPGTAVRGELDRYAGAWVASAREACQATRVRGDQSEELLDRRMACLDQRRAALEVVTRSFTAIEAPALATATRVTANLPRVEDCGDRSYVAQATATSRATQLGEELMKARMLLVASRDKEALKEADAALAIARELGDRTREVEAMLIRGRIQTFVDGPASIETLVAAVDLAGKTDSIGVRVDAWEQLSLAYQRVGRLELAGQVLERATAALKEAPDRWREANLLSARGTFHGRSGKFEEARRDFEQVIAILTELVGPDSQLLSAAHGSMATALRRLGRSEEALVHARRSHALASQLGERHDATVAARADIAVLLGELGRYDDARKEIAEAIAAMRGENEPQRARLETVLGSIYGDAGRWREAREHHAVAASITKGVDAAARSKILASFARSTQMTGDLPKAEELFREVLATRLELLGPDHADVAEAREYYASVLLERGRTDEAVAELARAQATIVKRAGENHAAHAQILLVMARAERARKQFGKALEHDKRALAIFEATKKERFISSALLAVAKDHLELDQRDLARPYAERALADLEAQNHAGGISIARRTLAVALEVKDPARAKQLLELDAAAQKQTK